MDSDLVVELIGYLGSAMIVISLTRTSLLKLRLFGLVGATFFLIYSLIIKAYPIAVVNVLIVGIHVFFLRDLLSKKTEFFTTLEVRADSRILAYFLDKTFPSFTFTSCCPWTSDNRRTEARSIFFMMGERAWYRKVDSKGFRALPVRDPKKTP